MKFRLIPCFPALLLIGGLSLAGASRAEQGERAPGVPMAPGEAGRPPGPPPGPPPGWGERQHGEERERGERRVGEWRGPGGKGPNGRPPMWGEGFERLSEDKKRRVREALEKAWGRPEVAAARERLMKANDEMREAIHQALKEIDPEIATLLASMRGPESRGRGEPPRMPEPASPEFPGAVVRRLEMELLAFAPPERREEVRKLHARLLEEPEIRDAVQRLNAAPVAERVAAMEALRKMYREGVGREIGKNREKREEMKRETEKEK